MTISFVVGEQWERDLHYLAEHASDVDGLDLTLATDYIDIVVHGRNLTSEIDEVSPVPLVLQLVEGAANQADGNSSKTIVEFEHVPYELAFEVFESDTILSFYRVDRVDIEVCDVAIDSEQFLAELQQVARLVVDDLTPAFSAHPNIVRLRESLSRLRPTARAPIEKSGAQLAFGSETERTAIEVSVEPTRGFLSYDGSNAFDLHALLFPTDLHIRIGEHSVGISAPFYFAIDSLLKVAEAIVERVSFSLPSGLSVAPAKGGVELRIPGASADGETFIVQTSEMFTDLHDSLLALNVASIDNLRYAGLVERFSGLVGAQDQFESRADVGDVDARPDFRIGVRLDQVRAFYPRRIWRRQISGSSDDSVATDKGVFVPVAGGLLVLEPQTGDTRAELGGVERFVWNGDDLVCSGSGNVKVVDLGSFAVCELPTKAAVLSVGRSSPGCLLIAQPEGVWSWCDNQSASVHQFGWQAVHAVALGHHTVAFGRGVAMTDEFGLLWQRALRGAFVRAAVTPEFTHVWTRVGRTTERVTFDTPTGTPVAKQSIEGGSVHGQRGALVVDLHTEERSATLQVLGEVGVTFELSRFEGTPTLHLERDVALISWSSGTVVAHDIATGELVFSRSDATMEGPMSISSFLGGALMSNQNRTQLIELKTGRTLFDFDGVVDGGTVRGTMNTPSGKGGRVVFGESTGNEHHLSAIAIENFLALV